MSVLSSQLTLSAFTFHPVLSFSDFTRKKKGLAANRSSSTADRLPSFKFPMFSSRYCQLNVSMTLCRIEIEATSARRRMWF